MTRVQKTLCQATLQHDDLALVRDLKLISNRSMTLVCCPDELNDMSPRQMLPADFYSEFHRQTRIRSVRRTHADRICSNSCV